MNVVEDVKSGKVQLVDVRSKLEWKMGHAKDAVHIPLDTIMNGSTDKLDPKKPVYVYCASGNRSGMAASSLQQQGFSVTNIGGLRNWQAAGGAVVR